MGQPAQGGGGSLPLPTNTFTNVMDAIVATLIASPDLLAVATQYFGKGFTAANVKKVFKARPDVLVGEFPLIMVTRPATQGQADNSLAGTYEHTVRLYIGFIQNDRFKAQEAMIYVEETIEKALMVDSDLGGLVDFVSPSSSENDEGYNHPQYWIVKEFKITRETTWT